MNYAEWKRWIENGGKTTALYAPVIRLSRLSTTYPIICCHLSGGKDSLLTTYSLFYAKEKGLLTGARKIILSHTDCEWQWGEARQMVIDCMNIAEGMGIDCDYKALQLKWENCHGVESVSWSNGLTPVGIPSHWLNDGEHTYYGMDQRDEQVSYSWRLAAENNSPILNLVSIRIAESMNRRKMLKNLADNNGIYGWNSCRLGPRETGTKEMTIKTAYTCSPVYDLTNDEMFYFATRFCGKLYSNMSLTTNNRHKLRVASLLNVHSNATEDIRHISPETYVNNEERLNSSIARERTTMIILSEAQSTGNWQNAIRFLLTMYDDNERECAIKEIRRGMRLGRFPKDDTIFLKIAKSLTRNSLQSDWNLKRQYPKEITAIKKKYMKRLMELGKKF